MSEEKSTEPQANAPETESLTDENLESVSGGTITDPTFIGCILFPPDEPVVSPFGPIVEL